MLTRNRPTPEGRALGTELVRLIEPDIARLAGDEGEPDERCSSCAFRLGTFPNGCPETVMDALKSVMEGVLFTCHMKMPEGSVACHGWYAARVAMNGNTKQMPWPFGTGHVPDLTPFPETSEA